MKTQDFNLGDLLINKLLINFLIKNKKDIIFDASELDISFCKNVLSDIPNPIFFSTKRNLTYYIQFFFAPFYFDAIILPPGATRKATLFDVKTIFILLYFKLTKIKVIKLGRSYSSNTFLGEYIQKTITFLTHYTLVRDEKSLKRIKLLENQKNIACASDLIILLEKNEQELNKKLDYFIASFRYPQNSTVEEKSIFVKKSAQFLYFYAKKYNLKIKLTWQVSIDEECMRSVECELKKMGLMTELEEITL